MATTETRTINPFSRLVQAAKRTSGNFLYGPPLRPPLEPTAPYNLVEKIRTTGLANSNDIENIIHAGFGDVGFYLLMKGLDNQPAHQENSLEQYVNAVLNPSADQKIIDASVINSLQLIKPDSQIVAAKFITVHAQGYNLWTERFRAVTTSLKEGYPNATPVYNSYAGLIGLREGIVIYRGGNMIVLIPTQIEDNTNCYGGYQIDLQQESGKRVTLLPKDFERPEAVFIDDIKRHGTHLRKMAKFWYQDPSASFEDSRVGTAVISPPSENV